MTDSIYNKGSIITDEQFAPFNRYIDINGLRMFVLDDVSDEFVLDVVNTFEAMFPQNSDTIDLSSQQLILKSMKDYKHFQRIGYIGPSEYGGEPAAAPLNGDWEFAQDYIWEKPSSSVASQIGEVVEHLLHTITTLSLKYTFPEKWDWDDTSSDVYLAMQEAIDKGIYNVSSYSSLKNDPEGYNKTIVQEFVYWFVSAEWNYFEVMGLSVNGSWEGGTNEEWSLLTSQEVEEELPLAHKLYEESFSKLIQKPDTSKVTEWFSTDSAVTDLLEDDTSSGTDSNISKYSLSDTLDLEQNVLTSHTEEVISGTLNFNKGNNIVILDGQAKTYRGLEGDDTYFVSQLLPKNGKVSITDTEGLNIIQIPSNTYIDKSLFTKNAARLTLEDGREITISGADKFSYNLGGNITSGKQGTDLTFIEFAEVFGVNDILNSSDAQTGNISDLYII